MYKLGTKYVVYHFYLFNILYIYNSIGMGHEEVNLSPNSLHEED